MTPEQINQIGIMKQQGLTVEEIAKRTGNHFETVRRICHKYGFIKPRNMSKRLSVDDMERFKQLWLSKTLIKDIAKMMGISVPSARRLARALKLPGKYSGQHPVQHSLRSQAVQLYRQGLTTSKVGQQLGLDPETVRGYITRYDPTLMRSSTGVDKSHIARQDKIIKEMYLAGVEYSQIAEMARIGPHGIEKRLHKMGLTRKEEYHSQFSAVPKTSMRYWKVKKIFSDLNVNVNNFDQYLYLIRAKSNLTGKWRNVTRWVEFENLRPKVIELIKRQKNFQGHAFIPEARIILKRKRLPLSKLVYNQYMTEDIGRRRTRGKRVGTGQISGQRVIEFKEHDMRGS